MSAPARLAAFGALLAVLFAAAFAAGRLVDSPVSSDPPAREPSHGSVPALVAGRAEEAS